MKRSETKLKTERLTAEERRDEVLRAAIREFAEFGLHGASTEAIAKRVGISQPYIFRLFGTKKELFLAAQRACYARILQGFVEAHAEAVATGAEILPALGQTYARWLADRDELLLLLQGFAAGYDPEVRALAQSLYGELYHYVEGVSGADAEEVRSFFATGMLMTIGAALDLPRLARQEEWASKLLGHLAEKL